jgi:AcrR family transcriptional regulator
MTKGNNDRRVQKTRTLLKEALISLIIEKGFEAISIQEILDRANVGRSTFYIHFENKQDLLHSCFEEFHKMFEKYDLGAAGTDDFEKTDFILNLFRLVERNQHLCKALLGKDDMSMFFNPIHSYIYNYFEGSVKKLVNKNLPQLQKQMLTHYITSALLGILRWWVYNDMPITAEELDKNFRTLALGNIQQALM